ncbi:MAG TPA: hypothetical protein VFV50_10465 [Bdellovibrionales bacterium]|nr:hypothetical protein [Bdellovibrionales bacterium]
MIFTFGLSAQSPQAELCYRTIVAGHRRECKQVPYQECAGEAVEYARSPKAVKPKSGQALAPSRKPACIQKTRTECKDLPYYREEPYPCKSRSD